MRTPANIAKHPIHPMLVSVPIGLWIFSLICDLIHRLGGTSDNWQVVAFYTMVGGVIGGLIAAIPGFIDMLSLHGRLKWIALTHMSLNLTIIALYVANIWLRAHAVQTFMPLWLSIIAVGVLAISGWLGGKMVYVHGVAVDTPPSTSARGERPDTSISKF